MKDAIPMRLLWWKAAQLHWKISGHLAFMSFKSEKGGLYKAHVVPEIRRIGEGPHTFTKTELTQQEY